VCIYIYIYIHTHTHTHTFTHTHTHTHFTRRFVFVWLCRRASTTRSNLSAPRASSTYEQSPRDASFLFTLSTLISHKLSTRKERPQRMRREALQHNTPLPRGQASCGSVHGSVAHSYWHNRVGETTRNYPVVCRPTAYVYVRLRRRASTTRFSWSAPRASSTRGQSPHYVAFVFKLPTLTTHKLSTREAIDYRIVPGRFPQQGWGNQEAWPRDGGLLCWSASLHILCKKAHGLCVCVNLQACLDHTFQLKRASCLVNPRSGYETELNYHQTAAPLSVAVVSIIIYIYMNIDIRIVFIHIYIALCIYI